MGTIKDLAGRLKRLHNELKLFEEDSDNYAKAAKSALLTLANTINALDKVEDEAQDKKKPLKDRQTKTASETKKHVDKFLGTLPKPALMADVTSGINSLREQFDHAVDEAKKIKIAVPD